MKLKKINIKYDILIGSSDLFGFILLNIINNKIKEK